jgi:outer membrane protein TolC
MNRLVLATLISLLPAIASAATTLSLNDAIAMAIAHNRTIANAEAQVDRAEEDVASARSRRLPTFKIETQASQLLRPVDLTFARAAFGEFPGIGPVPATDTNIRTPAKMSFLFDMQASQPLTQLHTINLNVRLSEASREYQREQLRDAELAVVAEIRRTYFSIAQTHSALDANLQTLTLLHELSRVVSTRVVQQVALKADALGVEARLADADLARVKLQNAFETQKEQLNLLIGRDVRTPFDVNDVPDTTIAEVDLIVAQGLAMDARPDIRQARIRLQQAELARRVAKADYIPDVALAVSYISPINIDGAPRQIATAAVQAQWEPFDWGRRARTLTSKDLDIRQARNNVREAEDRALVEVNSRFRRLEEARAQLRSARLVQQTSQETARVRAAQYDVHAALISDVLQAQAALADADNQYQQALAAFWTARADFERALGEDIIQ